MAKTIVVVHPRQGNCGSDAGGWLRCREGVEPNMHNLGPLGAKVEILESAHQSMVTVPMVVRHVEGGWALSENVVWCRDQGVVNRAEVLDGRRSDNVMENLQL